MALTEAQAREVVLVQTLEQGRDTRDIWTPGDAREASRAAREAAHEKSSFDDFLRQRTRWVLDQIARQTQSQRIEFSGPPWTALALAAGLGVFLLGMAGEHFVGGRRLDILAIPLISLIVWNVLVYLYLCGAALARFVGKSAGAGLIADRLARVKVHSTWPKGLRDQAGWRSRFEAAWSQASAPVEQSLVAASLHAAAALLTLGALLSFGARLFITEYQAGWESSYRLSPEVVHAIANAVFYPGAVLFNLEMPTVERIASLRFYSGAGELAHDWVFLYAGALMAWIVIPRTLLAGLALWSWRRQKHSFPLATRGTYFAPLHAVYQNAPLAVAVIPFRYELSAQTRQHITGHLERLYGMAVRIRVYTPVLMGEDPHDWKHALAEGDQMAVLVISHLSATAEPELHGKLMKQALRSAAAHTPVLALVDTGQYPADDVERVRERCNQWRSVLALVHTQPLFVNFAIPHDEDTSNQLRDRLNEDARNP